MKSRRYEFTVTGTFPFPCDMLRYDGCYPRGTEDAQEIEASFSRHGEKPRKYTVTLVSDRPPTGGRWSSFMWHVV